MAVAADARIRRLPSSIARDERLDHTGPELVAKIDREVREAHRVRQGTGLSNRGRRAAAALGVVLGVGPQLQRDRHRLPSVAGQERGDGAVDSTAHRDQRAPGRWPLQLAPLPHGTPQRSCERIGGQLGRVTLCDAETAELGGD